MASTKIVILDGHTLNPGDLTWKPFEKLGEVSVFDRSSPFEIAERCADAQVVITNKAVLTAKTIRSLPKLKYIGVTATGYNVVAVEAASENNIVVTNVPAYGTESVAQHTFALILEIANQVGIHNRSVHDGTWSSSQDFSYTLRPMIELKGKTLGILGWGKIGKKVAELGRAFDMKVLVSSSYAEDDEMFVGVEDLFTQSDVLSIHTQLTSDKIGSINNDLLKLMKKSAILINTSRGAIINESDLAEALKKKKIFAAGLDVLTSEPPESSNPLLDLENCFITPHNSWGSKEARIRLMKIAARNVEAFLKGDPINQVGQ